MNNSVQLDDMSIKLLNAIYIKLYGNYVDVDDDNWQCSVIKELLSEKWISLNSEYYGLCEKST